MPENKRKLKVLVMEDEPVISRILTRTLSSEGMEVDSAENGLIAKDKITSGDDYDLFIFDIRTPIINGMQLYNYLEEFFPTATSKILFMTGDCLNTATSCFLERVNRPVLHKPFTPEELMESIKRVTALQITSR